MFQLVDYETRSWSPLPRVGSYLYSRDVSTSVICVGVSEEAGRVSVRDRIGPVAPGQTIVSWGRFDYHIYRNVEKEDFPSERWVDLMALSRYVGMPGGLDKAADIFGIPMRKDPRGKRLINKYCVDPSIVIPDDELAMIHEYCAQDVRVLQQLWKTLKPILPEWEKFCRKAYEVTESMNDRGVPIDVRAVRAALFQCELNEQRITSEMQFLTGLNPTQTVELARRLGLPSVDKQTLETAKFENQTDARVAFLRLEFAKAAAKKLKPMLDMSRIDGRAHGCFVFNGAMTGRGSSRDIQFQNMKRAKVVDSVFDDLYHQQDKIHSLDTISKNIRGFVHSPGRKIVIADYSQVEARIVAWMADETSMLEDFKANRDVYKRFASEAYKVRVEGVTDLQRTFGKITVLGSGYGAGGKRLAEQSRDYGVTLSEEEGTRLRDMYLRIYPKVPKMWNDLGKAARDIATGRYKRADVAKCSFLALNHGNTLGIKLPSGRVLRYFYPRIDEDGELTYLSKYGRRKIWGGHWTENIAQAIATDLKHDAMTIMHGLGLELILEVHDEIVVETDPEKADRVLAGMLNIMQDAPDWIPDGLIRAEGKVVDRYTK